MVTGGASLLLVWGWWPHGRARHFCLRRAADGAIRGGCAQRQEGGLGWFRQQLEADIKSDKRFQATDKDKSGMMTTRVCGSEATRRPKGCSIVDYEKVAKRRLASRSRLI